jgi:hypothetical protein
MIRHSRTWFSRAAVSLAALMVAAVGVTGTASAADFGDGSADYEPPYSSGKRPYLSGEDHGDRERYAHRGSRHDDDDDDYVDDDDDYDDDDDGHVRRQADRGPRHEPHVNRPPVQHARCAPGWRVKQRLQSDGWTRFRLANFGDGVAVIRAERHHSGRPFLLKIDRCSGTILSSRPVYGRDWSGYSEDVRYSAKD